MLVIALGIVTFLVAAKTHGRQLRIEREMAGIWKVSFRGGNPAFVTQLWRRERYIFWGTAIAIAAADFFLLRDRVLGLLLLPTIGGFVVGAAASVARWVRALEGATSADDWRRAAVRGTIAWCAMTIALVVALLACAAAA